MNKHINCHDDCCHQIECCPKGLIEHIKNYQYMRSVTNITFREYWLHEIKSFFVKPEKFDDSDW